VFIMDFQIVFDNTGDTIPFVYVHPVMNKMFPYFLDQLASLGIENKFNNISDLGQKAKVRRTRLCKAVIEINHRLSIALDEPFSTHQWDEYLDQDVLNSLHLQMAKKKYVFYDVKEKLDQYPTSPLAQKIFDMFPDDIPVTQVCTIASKFGLTGTWDEINTAVHQLEYLFEDICYKPHTDLASVNIPNVFPDYLITDNLANLRFQFWHVGRLLYNKFATFDDELEYDDINNFSTITDRIAISLGRPITRPLAPEYIKWCQQKNRTPTGNFLNIGNIPDLVDKLTVYRQILVNNSLANNSFSFHL
jgi:hypothetical protein